MPWMIVRGPRRFLKAAISVFAAGTTIGSMLVFNAFTNLADSGPPLTLEELVSMRGDQRRLLGPTTQGSCQSLWKQKVAFDRKAFEAAYCDGLEQRRGSGLSVVRGVLHGTELTRMQASVRAIPYPRRYICGLTSPDTDPPVECVVTDAMMTEQYPRMRELVNQAVAADKLSMTGFHHVVRISAQQRVPELMTRPKFMRRFSATAALHAGSLSRAGKSDNMVLGYLTEQLGIPLWSGFHDWHVDGVTSSAWGLLAAAKQLWIMIDKNTTRHETDLVVVPKDAYAKYSSTIPSERGDSDRSCWDRVLDLLGCAVHAAPGDAVVYEQGIYHRTQDALNDREVLSADLQRIALWRLFLALLAP